MTRPGTHRYSLRWTAPNLAALVLLTAAGGAWTGWQWAGRPLRAGRDLPVLPGRVEAAAERVNPNTASAASLRRLPGLGPVRVGAILAYRRAHGPRAFRRAADLARVRGIGPATVGRIDGWLTFEQPAASAPAAAPQGP